MHINLSAPIIVASARKKITVLKNGAKYFTFTDLKKTQHRSLILQNSYTHQGQKQFYSLILSRREGTFSMLVYRDILKT